MTGLVFVSLIFRWDQLCDPQASELSAECWVPNQDTKGLGIRVVNRCTDPCAHPMYEIETSFQQNELPFLDSMSAFSIVSWLIHLERSSLMIQNEIVGHPCILYSVSFAVGIQTLNIEQAWMIFCIKGSTSIVFHEDGVLTSLMLPVVQRSVTRQARSSSSTADYSCCCWGHTVLCIINRSWHAQDSCLFRFVLSQNGISATGTCARSKKSAVYLQYGTSLIICRIHTKAINHLGCILHSPTPSHGVLMECSWIAHGLHGVLMECSWRAHGLLMDSMECSWSCPYV